MAGEITKVIPAKGQNIHEEDFALIYGMIADNTLLSGLAPSYSSSSLVLSLETGDAVIKGRLISSSVSGDFQLTLPANSIKYIYLWLETSNCGRNAAGARLIAVADRLEFADAILICQATTSETGVSNLVDMRMMSVINKYAHAGSGLNAPYDAMSLSAPTERTVTGTTETEVKSFRIEHPGTVRIDCEMNRSAGTGTCKVYTTSGGVTPVATLTATTTTYTAKSYSFPVQIGDIVSIKLVSSYSTYTTRIRNVVLSYRFGPPMAPAVLLN